MQANLTIAAISDRGVVRTHNEDAFAVLESSTGEPTDRGSLLIVADGLGGHNAGEFASQIAISTIRERYQNSLDLSREQDVKDAILAAHHSIVEEARRNALRQGMGTTIALVAVHGDSATAAHVGDSRVYLLRNGVLSRLTLDHSWVEQQIFAGELPIEAASEHPLRHVITQALGAMEAIEPSTYTWQLRAGDLMLLSTDGLHGLVSGHDLHEILTTHSPDDAVHALVKSAKELGGPDNITAIIARVDSLGQAAGK
jgi:PPM family protein phosphatase